MSAGLDDSNLCDFCEEMVDSPEHQIFECKELKCPERELLLDLMEHDIIDFKWKILTLGAMQNQQYAVELFTKVVQHIEKTLQSILSSDAIDTTYN